MVELKIKNILKALFKGMVLPVISPQLKGMRLKVDPLMPGNLFFNNVEEPIHKVYDIFVKEGYTVFDIGANVGLHSYYISRQFKNTKVYAFEPFPENARYIKQMILLNKIHNIKVIEKAVGCESAARFFDTSINNHQGYITQVQSGLTVNMTSLDDFIMQSNLKPDFIKIDVEGGEADVLDGFKKYIASVYPVMVIEVHNSEQAQKVGDFFTVFNYSLFKLLYNSKNSRLSFLEIDKGENVPGVSQNLNGQVIAIPDKILQSYTSYIEAS